MDRLEWLDQGRGSAWDVRQNLVEMDRINHWLGGLAAMTHHLYPRIRVCRGPVRIADLGTGSAGIPAAIQAWSRRRGMNVQVIGLDWAQRNLEAARELQSPHNPVPLLRADARRLPFAPGQIQYFISSMFLHHLDPDTVMHVLRRAFELCSEGLVMSDLIRGRMPEQAFRLASPVFARHPLTYHDGILSIRRAYTPAELLNLAQQAGLSHARVHVHAFWRMTLVADK